MSFIKLNLYDCIVKSIEANQPIKPIPYLMTCKGMSTPLYTS